MKISHVKKAWRYAAWVHYCSFMLSPEAVVKSLWKTVSAVKNLILPRERSGLFDFREVISKPLEYTDKNVFVYLKALSQSYAKM